MLSDEEIEAAIGFRLYEYQCDTIRNFIARAVEAATEDAFLRKLGLDPDTYRTDGGEVNHLKVKAAIRNPNDYPLLCQHELVTAPSSLGGQIYKHCGGMK